MKINEVEAAVGVTKKNIRFYEEEGLISPRREPGNGYRSYSEADVERLRRIKLLRKLDVPLAEIRQMLEGECTLAEGMTRQLERLNTRRTDLDEAVNFCTLLQRESVSLNELDVEQTLARLTAKEEQGVSFVNIEQTDRKAERVRGALVGAGLFTAIMLLSIGIMAWSFCVDPQDVPPLPLLVVLFGGMSPDKSFGQGLKAGLGDAFTVFLNTISAFGNIMSYIRLFAVGMASLAIAQSFNNMALGFKGPLVIATVLILLIGHGLNIVMGLLSVVVHGVRLNLLEFSGQLGMEWAGIAYDPFKKRDKIKK